MSRWFIGVAVGLVVALAPPRAQADEGAHERAAAAFLEARKLIEQGNCDEAVPKLRESLAYESSIGARLSIADCIEARDPLQAWKVLKEAAALSLMNRDERLAVTEERALALQSRLALLVFALPAATERPGFELRVDGEVVDRYLYRSGYATMPGNHRVEASAPGQRFSGAVTAAAGVATPVTVALQQEDCRGAAPPPVAASTSASSEIDPGASQRTLGLAVGAVGVAGVATGIVFGILTLDRKKSIENACGGTVLNCAAPAGSLDAETESAKTAAAISTVSLAVGGAALLGGAALYLTAPSRFGPRTGVRVSPRASRGGAGLGVEGFW
ncbi:MAG: hypothetical protein KF764_15940 [Labilithrix sp.]|nr:hypothetical protein [Labilithrix sp.]MBX3221751.1 hypothetical protein [Labilithrix sp.]